MSDRKDEVAKATVIVSATDEYLDDFEDDDLKDGLQRAIEDLEEAGFDVGASLRGWFWIDPALLEAEGEIGEDYCWSHKPGGWICKECQAALKEVRE